MKFFHLADFHLGIRLNAYSLLEDQRHVLQQIIGYVESEKPDAVLLAGDIYDRSVPPEEAVKLLDEFLNSLVDLRTPCCLIAGNHDSAERLAFAKRLLKTNRVHIAGAYEGKIERVAFSDEYGSVYVHLLPFIKPPMVRHCFPNEKIEDYNDALRLVLAREELEPEARHILLAHQYVCGALFSGTDEPIQVGGVDNAAAELFDAFDYTALGHIHRPQDVCGRQRLRYSGTPLKYNATEINQEKSITVVELGAKGDIKKHLLPLKPLRDMKILQGSYNQLISRDFYSQINRDDFVQIVLTDREEVPDAMRKLQGIYSHILRLKYLEHDLAVELQDENMEQLRQTPLALFQEFYYQQHRAACSAEQIACLEAILADIGG